MCIVKIQNWTSITRAHDDPRGRPRAARAARGARPPDQTDNRIVPGCRQRQPTSANLPLAVACQGELVAGDSAREPASRWRRAAWVSLSLAVVAVSVGVAGDRICEPHCCRPWVRSPRALLASIDGVRATASQCELQATHCQLLQLSETLGSALGSRLPT